MTPNHALTALVLVLASAAIASRSEAYTPDVTILARTCVAESGTILTADCAAILHVLERRGARVGRTAAETALRYASVHRAPQGELGRSVRYASLLTLAERAPAVVALVIAWVRGERVADPCPGAMHWGDAHRDRERAERAGWVRVRCTEPTANLFWREPRVIRGES